MMQDKKALEASSFVDSGTLPVFCPDVPEPQRQDLLNSTLLGQLVADKRHARKTEPQEWYSEYFKTLGNLGWVFDSTTFKNIQPKVFKFTIEEIVMRLLRPKTSAEERALVQETMRSLRNLPDTDPHVIVFNDGTHSESSVNAQVSVRKSEVMVNVGVVFTTSQKLKSLLHEKLETKSLESDIQTIVQVATLNEAAYSDVRESVIQKLGSKRKELILELDIGIDRRGMEAG